MSGFDNEVVVSLGERLEPSTAQAIMLMQKNATDVSRINHEGNPESVVAANPSSLCHDPISGNLYLKRTGTGNTGWQNVGDIFSLTPDTGGEVTSSGETISVLGYQAGTVPVMQTYKVGDDLLIANQAWQTQYVVDPSVTDGLKGTFQTIQAAITAATAPANIFIRPGTYTEDLTLKAGVNLVASTAALNSATPVTIRGKATLTSGLVGIENISLKTNGDYYLDLSGSATVNLHYCILQQSNAAGMLLVNGRVNLFECLGLAAGSGALQYFVASSTSTITIINSYLLSAATSPSTLAGSASLTLRNSTLQNEITTSGTASLTAFNSALGRAGVTFTLDGTSGNDMAFNCSFLSGVSTAISIGAGATFTMSNCTVSSSNASVVSGAGTLVYDALSCIGTSSLATVTTQTARVLGPLLNAGAFAGRYTTTGISYAVLRSDYIIACTAGAITITLPITGLVAGQMFIVKDFTGAAANNNITVTCSGGAVNIDAATTAVININYGSLTVCWSGAKYFLI